MSKDEETFVAEQLVATRKIKDRREYLVRWVGYDEDEATWEPKAHILDKRLRHEFHDGPGKNIVDLSDVSSDDDEDESDAEECEVDAIVAMRTVKGGGLEYLVRWLNPADQIPESWEPASNFPVEEWEQVAQFWRAKGQTPPLAARSAAVQQVERVKREREEAAQAAEG